MVRVVRRGSLRERLVRRMKVEVKVGRGRSSVLKVPVLVPSVSVELGVSAPDSVFPGESGSGSVVLTYVEGSYEPVEWSVYLDGSRVGGRALSVGESLEVPIAVGPGSHRVEARIGEVSVVGVDFRVKRRTPQVRPVVEEGVVYPEGGSALVRFVVLPRGSTVEDVRVSSPEGGSRVWAVLEGPGHARVNVEGPEPSSSLEVRLLVRVRAPDGKVDEIPVDVSIPVRVSEEFIALWDRRVQELAELVSSDSVPLEEVRARLSRALKECRRTAAPFEYDCSVIEELIDEVEKEVKGLSARVSQVLEEAERSPREALELLRGVLEECEGPRYRGVDICGVEKLSGVAVKVLESAASVVGELVDGGRIDEAEPIIDLAVELCSRSIPGTGFACGRIERLRNSYRSILMALDSVSLKVRERYGLKRIIANIIIDYKGSARVTDVYVDLSPAEGYVSLKEKKIPLPPIYPNTMFELEVQMKSRVKSGIIPIPYKVCWKNYCKEKIVQTQVGTAGAPEGAVALIQGISIDMFLGRQALGLRKYRLARPMPRIIPTRTQRLLVDEYTCNGILGDGGFAVTLICSDKSGMNFAIKILKDIYNDLLLVSEQRTADLNRIMSQYRKEGLKAFEREARILGLLDHPHVVKLEKYTITPYPYLVFEFCEYGDLGQLLHTNEARTLDLNTAIEIMIPIGLALEHGHTLATPIYHRDVKPSNILITRTFTPKLSDYNIAKIASTISKQSTTITGYTQGFGAPEQTNPTYGHTGPYTDIFSHAATLYYLISREHPYPVHAWSKKFEDPEKYKYRKLSKHNPDIPERLDDVLETALAIYPTDRYQNIREYLTDLYRAVQKP